MQQRRNAATPQNDRGAVAVIVALMAVLLIGMSAFAVDLGLAYASKRQLSVAADSAALAGAQAAGRAYPVGTECTEAVAAALTDTATSGATAVYQAQESSISTGIEVAVECAGPDALNVRVVDSSAQRPIFGGLLNPGQGDYTPGATATAQVSGSPGYSGLRPFAVCSNDVAIPGVGGVGETGIRQSLYWFQSNGGGNGGGDEEPEPDPDAPVDCTTTSGNWGLVDLDDDVSNNNSADTITDWTEFGYSGTFESFPRDFFGNPGTGGFNTQKTQEALDSLLGQIVLFPVATQWVEGVGGENGTFSSPGLVAVEFCGWKISEKKRFDDTIPGCWDYDLETEIPSDADLAIQWRQVDYVTSYVGAGDPACGLDDQFCIPTVRLYG